MVVAVARIPARTGFHLSSPSCDVQLSLENVARSMTKLPHMILFGLFFLLTMIQFDRVDRRTLAWSFLATVVLGLIVEIEEGATRTGNCRITDVLPDFIGAIVVMALVIIVVMIRNRLGDTRATPVRR
jgi:VanZ family protein